MGEYKWTFKRRLQLLLGGAAIIAVVFFIFKLTYIKIEQLTECIKRKISSLKKSFAINSKHKQKLVEENLPKVLFMSLSDLSLQCF